MNQPLSRPTAPARPDGARAIRAASGRTPYRPSGAATFSQVLRSAQGPSEPVAPRPAGGALFRPTPLGLDALSALPGMAGLASLAGAGQPTGAGADGATMLAAMSVARRPVVLPAPAAAARPPAPRGPQPPTRGMIDGFMRSIQGFDQTKASEYDSPAQARTWGYSSCSAASLTAVLRAAGRDVKIADVMREMPNGMTVALGLVSRPALVAAANAFGAKATDDVTSYDGLRAATEAGQPVLVDIRNRTFSEGHFVVVTGVEEDGVRVADSSRHDLKFIPRAELMRSWSGRGIRVDGLVPTAQPVTAQPATSRPVTAQPGIAQPAPARPTIAQPGLPATRTA